MKKLLIVMTLLLSLASAGFAKLPDTSIFTGCGEFTPGWSINGRITNPSGQPLGKTTVTMLASDSYLPCQKTISDSDGTYVFYPVYVPNYYYLRFTRTGSVTQEQLTYCFAWMDPVNIVLQPNP